MDLSSNIWLPRDNDYQEPQSVEVTRLSFNMSNLESTTFHDDDDDDDDREEISEVRNYTCVHWHINLCILTVLVGE